MGRILQLTSKLPYPPDDGGRIASWNLARCLRHNGHAIDLVCFASDPSAVEAHRAALGEVFASVHLVAKDIERQHPADLASALVRGSSYFVRKFWSLRLADELRWRLQSGRFDATLIEFAFMGVYLPLLREHPTAGRIILRAHNVEYEIFERMAEREPRRWARVLLRREARLFRHFELDLLERVDAVKVISQRDADVLAAAGCRARPEVLEAFLDVEAYRPDGGTGPEPGHVVSVANLGWQPNVHGILWFCEHVWPGVLHGFPQARLSIVGKRPPPAVQRLAGPAVNVTGHVPDERPFLRRASLFIVPLFEGSGVRIKILTALAAGARVLATPVGAEGIDFPGLRLARSAEEWRAAVLEELRRPPEVCQAGIEYVRQRHDWRRPLSL